MKGARLILATVVLLAIAPAGVTSAASGAGSSPAAVTVTKYPNCKAMNRRYPHGVGRVGARDHTSGSPPVTNFKRSNVLYNANKARDRDKDGIACEKL